MTTDLITVIASSIRQSIKDTESYNWTQAERLGFKEGMLHVATNLSFALKAHDKHFDIGQFMADCGV